MILTFIICADIYLEGAVYLWFLIDILYYFASNFLNISDIVDFTIFMQLEYLISILSNLWLHIMNDIIFVLMVVKWFNFDHSSTMLWFAILFDENKLRQRKISTAWIFFAFFSWNCYPFSWNSQELLYRTQDTGCYGSRMNKGIRSFFLWCHEFCNNEGWTIFRQILLT